MDTLQVIADFDFLPTPQQVGDLVHERVRGNSVFRFRYNPQWLDNFGSIHLCADLPNVPGWQFATDRLFGCFSDALPDRWGRTLIELREQLSAKAEGRPPSFLTSYDYLTLLDDTTRMGGLRFKKEGDGGYLNQDEALSVPPLTTIQELCIATENIERQFDKGELPEEKWIRQLYQPGSSLGGARPKANVVGTDNNLYIAKFPSRNDRIDVGLWEHLCHLLAAKAGITTASTSVLQTGSYHTFLSKRFDRNEDKRVHFASAMSLLGFTDGDGAQVGKGYLDIVDFILGNCTDTQKNLQELYRRVAFNICVGNSDDHFRNHGFLLTRQGWTLAPAYDLNPSLSDHLSLLINDNSNDADLRLLLDCHKDYFISHETACTIIQEVQHAVSQWTTIAKRLKIKPQEVAIFQNKLNRWLSS